MATVEDKRLEELRKFLTQPSNHPPEVLQQIVRDLTWAVEELQLRRVNERTIITPQPKPYLLFGSDEAVLAFAAEKQIVGDQWKHIESADQLVHVLPRTVQAHKLEGASPELWAEWEKVRDIYK